MCIAINLNYLWSFRHVARLLLLVYNTHASYLSFLVRDINTEIYP
jgi:hypothetical protein